MIVHALTPSEGMSEIKKQKHTSRPRQECASDLANQLEESSIRMCAIYKDLQAAITAGKNERLRGHGRPAQLREGLLR
eukprot:9180539-Alexandrium_andersonii.AAC.1